MKKLLILVFTCVLLSGCNSTATKTCNMEASGATVSISASAPDETSNIETCTIHLVVNYEALLIEEDAFKENADSYVRLLAANYALLFDFYDDDKYTYTYELNDDNVVIDLEFDADELKEIAEENNITLEKFVETFESEDYTCE